MATKVSFLQTVLVSSPSLRSFCFFCNALIDSSSAFSSSASTQLCVRKTARKRHVKFTHACRRGCRQESDLSRAHFALNLPRKDLRILVGILTGHVDLNWHLHITGLHQDSVCPLCQEEEDTTAHFIAQCSALMLLRKNILGEYILSSETLCSINWFEFQLKPGPTK